LTYVRPFQRDIILVGIVRSRKQLRITGSGVWPFTNAKDLEMIEGRKTNILDSFVGEPLWIFELLARFYIAKYS
jgi:hypothetical protein